MTYQHLPACTSTSSGLQWPLCCLLQEALGCTEQLLGSNWMGKCMHMLMNLLFYVDMASKRLSCASHYICGVWHQPQWLESTVPHGEVTLEGILDGQKGGLRPQWLLCHHRQVYLFNVGNRAQVFACWQTLQSLPLLSSFQAFACNK